MGVSTLAITMLMAGAPMDQESTAPVLTPPVIAAPAAPVPPVTSNQGPAPVSPAPTAPPVPAEQGTAQAASVPEPAPASAPALPSPDDINATDIVVTAHERHVPGDPVRALNATSFAAVQAVDKAFIGPVTHGYMKIVPKPVRSGLHNFLNNLDEPIVFVNFLLQLKPGKAVETLGRFAINSTVGAAGLIDVAKKKPFNLPRRFNGLADTLGYYGIGPGPYLFLPLIGSTTVRDMFGRVVDLSLLPTTAGKPFSDPTYSLSAGVLRSLDERAQSDDTIRRVRDQSPNPYASMREYYLAKRRAEIDLLRGKKTKADDPAAPVSPDGAPPAANTPAPPPAAAEAAPEPAPVAPPSQ